MASLNTRMKRQAEQQAKVLVKQSKLATAGKAGEANSKAVSMRVVQLFAQRDEIESRIEGYRRSFPQVVADVERLAAEIKARQSPIIKPAEAPLIQRPT